MSRLHIRGVSEKLLIPTLLGLVLVVAACRNEARVEEPGLLFSGECDIEVVSKTEHAVVYLDGVELGENTVKTSAACGEKQLRVERAGFAPYLAYIPLRKGEAQKVTVELKPSHKMEIPAFSDKIIAKAVASTAEKLAKMKSGAPASAASAPAGNDIPRDQWTNVENWR